MIWNSRAFIPMESLLEEKVSIFICFSSTSRVLQIENEYGPESRGAGGRAYVNWASTASMAVGLGTGMPWVMCKENDAPHLEVCPLILLSHFIHYIFIEG